MISAMILAAGQSKRMGRPKMLLPWGKSTVIEQVITTFLGTGVDDILVVTGGAREQVEQAIRAFPVRQIYNENHANAEMLASIQKGLQALPAASQAVLVGLGDQPQVQGSIVQLVCEAYRQSGAGLIVPSYRMRRGHPWLVARPFWTELLSMGGSDSPRAFLARHADEIHYVNVDTDTILADLDTLEDYERARPRT